MPNQLRQRRTVNMTRLICRIPMSFLVLSSVQSFTIHRKSSQLNSSLKDFPDEFTIPSSLCSNIDCHSLGGTRVASNLDQCRCECNDTNSVFGFYDGKWRCTKNDVVRRYAGTGCSDSFNDKTTEDELSTFPLEPYHSGLYITGVFYKGSPFGPSCRLAAKRATYLGCDGTWKPLLAATVKNSFQLFVTRSDKRLRIRARSNLAASLEGRIVNLPVKCGRLPYVLCVELKVWGRLDCSSFAPTPTPAFRSASPVVKETSAILKHQMTSISQHSTLVKTSPIGEGWGTSIPQHLTLVQTSPIIQPWKTLQHSKLVQTSLIIEGWETSIPQHSTPVHISPIIQRWTLASSAYSTPQAPPSLRPSSTAEPLRPSPVSMPYSSLIHISILSDSIAITEHYDSTAAYPQITRHSSIRSNPPTQHAPESTTTPNTLRYSARPSEPSNSGTSAKPTGTALVGHVTTVQTWTLGAIKSSASVLESVPRWTLPVTPTQTEHAHTTAAAMPAPTNTTSVGSRDQEKPSADQSAVLSGVLGGVASLIAALIIITVLIYIRRTAKRNRESTEGSAVDPDGMGTISPRPQTDAGDYCYAEVGQNRLPQSAHMTRDQRSSLGQDSSGGAVYEAVDDLHGYHVLEGPNVGQGRDPSKATMVPIHVTSPVYAILEEPIHNNVLEGPNTNETAVEAYAPLKPSARDPVYNVLVGPNANGASTREPVYNVLEGPNTNGPAAEAYAALKRSAARDLVYNVLVGANTNRVSAREPVYNVLEGPDANGASATEPIYNVLEGPNSNGVPEHGTHGSGRSANCPTNTARLDLNQGLYADLDPTTRIKNDYEPLKM